MQDSITHTFRGQTITVNELTVKQVREIFERIRKDPDQLIDDLVDQPVPVLAVCTSSGIGLDQLEDALPSELVKLFEKVAEVNPSLASMIRRRIEAANKLEAAICSAKSLIEPSAS